MEIAIMIGVGARIGPVPWYLRRIALVTPARCTFHAGGKRQCAILKSQAAAPKTTSRAATATAGTYDVALPATLLAGTAPSSPTTAGSGTIQSVRRSVSVSPDTSASSAIIPGASETATTTTRLAVTRSAAPPRTSQGAVQSPSAATAPTAPIPNT